MRVSSWRSRLHLWSRRARSLRQVSERAREHMPHISTRAARKKPRVQRALFPHTAAML